MRQLLVNRIITPDGTELISKHRHDCVIYIDKNGLEYMNDGGNDYLRRNIHKEHPYTEASLYSDSPFEELRECIYRGGRGKDGKQPLVHVKLSEMNNNWLIATIEYEKELRPNNIYLPYYKMEVEYRGKHNISIGD